MFGIIERFGQCEKQCGGAIRIFEDGEHFGDKYRYSFPFHEVSDGVIEIHSIVGRAPTVSEARAMLMACKEAGLIVLIERKHGKMVGKRVITRKSYAPVLGVIVRMKDGAVETIHER